ncbi:glycosyltransferase [Desulfovibrio ferrophilus]|uniref:Glycosyltransferase, CESA-like subfamily n=1 Tax=Desulfovibrio ferrophilus TaxID=241368 RepID=A0A2Z6B1B5_9BACT|nr:glycosyltransferase [Desulfovibrio ferrophilus]BBD09253.1 glycosyltransferase, CESA-like subfamily [Desulfovibrio ferrophilus]
MIIGGWLLIFGALLGLGLFVVVNPLLTWLISTLHPLRHRPADTPGLSVSLVIVVHNGRELIGSKLDNALALDVPPGGLEIIVHSDGSGDGTEEIVAAYADRGVKLSSSPQHRGKSHGLNTAASLATGDILVFSDVDALLAPDALTRLLSWFVSDRVGGVCGRRVVPGEAGAFEAAQAGYVGLDSRLKAGESRLGTLTSNDGKLYALRSGLFPEIPGPVTDDLYAALAVVSLGHLFLFDAEARARVAVPSRSPGVELKRRRRIVSTSLNAIACHRALLNPARYGFYSLRLLLNKVVRRLMPVFLLMLLAGSALAAAQSAVAALLLAGQIACMILAASFPLVSFRSGVFARVAGAAFYFYVGNLGMLWGLVDFVLGNLPKRWSPDKGGATQ